MMMHETYMMMLMIMFYGKTTTRYFSINVIKFSVAAVTHRGRRGASYLYISDYVIKHYDGDNNNNNNKISIILDSL